MEKWEAVCTVGMKTGAASVENRMEVPQKLKIELHMIQTQTHF